MLMVAVLLISTLAVPLCGGNLRQLANVHFRASGLLLAAIVLQLLVTSVFTGLPNDLSRFVHFVSYATAAGFLLANRSLAGMPTLLLGTALNVVAITANLGVMPASPAALSTAGIAAHSGTFENSAAVAEPRLLFLGDVFAVPSSVPFANVFSIGDVLIVAGGVWLIHVATRSRLAQTVERWRLNGSRQLQPSRQSSH